MMTGEQFWKIHSKQCQALSEVMQGKEEAAGKKRKQAAMDSYTLPHKINKWQVVPSIMNHLNGNKWMVISGYLLPFIT